ncbi:MAG: PH domain-containing protein [Desulfurobacteriaceae bacterium]
MKETFKTEKLTFISYGLLVVAYALFFFLLLKKSGGVNFSAIILLLFALPVLAYFLFLSVKKVVISEEGLEVVGITGKKRVKWEEISEVSAVPGRRNFLFISTKEGKLIVIDDSTENFKRIMEEVGKRVPEEKLSENYREALKNYKKSYGSQALILTAALVLIFLLLRSFL